MGIINNAHFSIIMLAKYINMSYNNITNMILHLRSTVVIK